MQGNGTPIRKVEESPASGLREMPLPLKISQAIAPVVPSGFNSTSGPGRNVGRDPGLLRPSLLPRRIRQSGYDVRRVPSRRGEIWRGMISL